jgi:hypothetical protein
MPLMNRTMYFGTKELMSYVRAPQIDYDASKVGWDGGVAAFLNGGAYVRRSTTSHKQYNFTWSNISRAEILLINDYADGVYGNGPFYFLDPFAMDTNLLPQYWATPRLVNSDGPVLSGAPRNTVLPTSATMSNTLGYPTTGAIYTYNSTTWPNIALRPSIYIPVPTGYTFWFGAHGVVSAANTTPVSVQADGGSPVYPAILGVADPTRFNYSAQGNITTGVTVRLGDQAGTATLAGMMAQVLPDGVTPATGGFISGQGNSGVRFATNPSLQQYSAAMDKVSLTAQLVEDQAWR